MVQYWLIQSQTSAAITNMLRSITTSMDFFLRKAVLIRFGRVVGGHPYTADDISSAILLWKPSNLSQPLSGVGKARTLLGLDSIAAIRLAGVVENSNSKANFVFSKLGS